MTTTTIDRLAKAQAVSGLLFAAFLAVHLINTWLAVGGPEIYDGLQAMLRPVYQFFVIEVLLVAALAAHAVIGVIRIRRRPHAALSARSRWHRYAGVFLLVVVFGHIAAVRGPSLILGIYPEFAGLSFSMAAYPGYFYPYYTLLAVAGFFHMFNGIGIASGRLGVSFRTTNAVLVSGVGVALVATVVALLALGGKLFPIADPFDNDFARLAIKLIDALSG